MQVNNSEVDLTLADIKERPSSDLTPDDRTPEDDIAIAQAVNEAEEELKKSSGGDNVGLFQNFFVIGVAAAVAGLLINQFGGFDFLK